jgi:hypothetical protein
VKNLILSLIFLLQCTALLYAQNTGESLESVLSSRSAYYQTYVKNSAAADSMGVMTPLLRKAMEDVIRIDDIIIEKHLFQEYDRANDLELSIGALKLELKKNAATTARFRTIALIAVPAAFLLLFVSLWFLIMLRKRNPQTVDDTERANSAGSTSATFNVPPADPENNEKQEVLPDLYQRIESLQEEMKRDKKAHEAGIASLETDKLILASKLEDAKNDIDRYRSILVKIAEIAAGSENAGENHSA